MTTLKQKGEREEDYARETNFSHRHRQYCLKLINGEMVSFISVFSAVCRQTVKKMFPLEKWEEQHKK